MTDRIPCVVPGCPRTTGRAVYIKRFKHEPGDWICGPHWQGVPKGWRRAVVRHRREERRYGFFPREAAYDRLWRAIYRELFKGG